jgi:hypothetical protein
MTMPVPFGFSAGDIIAVSILIKDVYKALDDTKGASAEYQELCRELWALDRALLEVEYLSRTCGTSAELNALSHTVSRIADQCRECIKGFLEKIEAYKRSLRDGGSGRTLRDVGMKIKWALTQGDTIAKFRTEINGHSSTINMLLITANMLVALIQTFQFDSSSAGTDLGALANSRNSRARLLKPDSPKRNLNQLNQMISNLNCSTEYKAALMILADNWRTRGPTRVGLRKEC